MISLEWALLSKLIADDDMKTALDLGIGEHVFIDRWAKKVWRHLHTYYTHTDTMGLLPTRDMVLKTFKSNKMIILLQDVPTKPELRSLCVDLLRENLTKQLERIGEDLMHNLESEDPDKTLEFLRQRTTEMCAMRRAGTDIDMSMSGDQIREDYLYVKENREGLGIPFPWASLNKEKKGMQEADFIVLYGRPKSMKTWLLLTIGAHAWERANKKVLIYTREMTPRQMRDRILSIILRVPYTNFRDSRLDEIMAENGEQTQEDRLFALLDTMEEADDMVFAETGSRRKLIITNDRETGIGGSISGLDAKVSQYKPDLILVDGAYLLHRDGQRENSSKWTEMTQITHALKSIAMRHNTPLVCTTQANRAGEDDGRIGSVADIAFSDSFGQDCDLAIKVVKKPIDKDHNELVLLVAAARECNMEGFVVHGNAATDFSEVLVEARYPDGTLKLDPITGKPAKEPMVFFDRKSIKDIFKQEDRCADEQAAIAGYVMKGKGATPGLSRRR